MDVDKAIWKKFRVKRRDTLPFTGWLKSTREDIYELWGELGYSYGAEVGVWAGRNASQIYKSVPNLKLILVDPWVPYSGRTKKSGYMESVYEQCKKRLQHRNPEYMRMSSIEASGQIKNESLDFVYIDGMHDFNGVMMDLLCWIPKVKKNGIISGHDYFSSYQLGVVRAVDAYTYANNITQWYITGGTSGTDNHPSYFWVKK